MNTVLLLLSFLADFLLATHGAKILMIMPFQSKSHTNIHEAVARALGSKGHKVTLLTPYPMRSQWPNVEWFQVGQPKEVGLLQFDIYEQRKQSILSMLIQSFKDDTMAALTTLPCESLFQTPKVKTILKEVEKKGKLYDVGIWDSVFCEYTLPFLGMAANHTVMLSVLPLPQWIAHYHRIPYPTSILPSFTSHFSTPTNFWERLQSAASSYFFLFFYNFLSIMNFQKMANKYLPPHAPSVEDVLKNLSFILTNENLVMDPPSPTTSFVATIGGIHLQESEPLPKEFEDFMQSSGDHGVILFSFGSYFDTRLMPKDMRDAFMNAFGRMKQKIIWKYHEPIEGISDNVKIVKWMPQRDLLAHPKLRLFITHGGRLSSMEVIYHGIPTIAIALFADQMRNAHRLASVGMGLEIDILDLTSDRIYDTATAIINNKSYSERVKELSRISRDKQNSPDETVNYWIEYIIRHNGASHLKHEMNQHLSWYQYLQLDVLALILLLFAICLKCNIVGFKMFLRCLRYIFKKNSSNKNKTKKE